jgi:hypothetical protein
VAAYLGTAQPKIAQIESGKAGISGHRLRSFATACSCENLPLVEALVAMTQERGKGWWDQYRGILPIGFLEIAEMEHHASALTCSSSVFIPGLFQTAAYAEAVFNQVVPPLPKREAEARTALRIERRQAARTADRPITVYLHEAALRMQFGGVQVLREQLEYLLDESERRPGVNVRVTPFDVDGPPGAGEDITYAHGPIPELDTVEFDVVGGPVFRDTESLLSRYRINFQRTDATALPRDEALRFIHDILRQSRR